MNGFICLFSMLHHGSGFTWIVTIVPLFRTNKSYNYQKKKTDRKLNLVFFVYFLQVLSIPTKEIRTQIFAYTDISAAPGHKQIVYGFIVNQSLQQKCNINSNSVRPNVMM